MENIVRVKIDMLSSRNLPYNVNMLLKRVNIKIPLVCEVYFMLV